MNWRIDSNASRRNDAFIPMFGKRQQKKPKAQVSRVRLTTRVTLAAYDAIIEIQRRHRTKTGRALRLWQVVDAAIITYAKRQGIAVGE